MKNSWFIYFLIISAKVYGQATPNIGKLDDAVGVVLCYDVSGNYLSHGSCFIIDEDGILVTNYHVLEDVYSAKIKLEDGNQYDLDKIISGNKDIDLCKFTIKKKYTNQKFPFDKVAISLPNKGEHVWAIGTPFDPALMNTVSDGVVANIYTGSTRTQIQTNASFAHGSSGGAFFNAKNEVIGVTTWGINDKEGDGDRANLNFAIWIGEINKLNYLNVDRIYNDAFVRVIGTSIRLGNLEVAQYDFPEPIMEWDEAKKACEDLGAGWRLPTKDEQQILYQNKNKIGGFAGNLYWSSTENDTNYAWEQSFDNGRQDGNDYKSARYSVRAVRAF